MTFLRALGSSLGALALVGCGLTLDLAPELDAGGMDGGVDRRDASASDGGAADASRGDANNARCARDEDCDPGDLCGGRESCVGGRCVPDDVLLGCDDGFACTEDSCDGDLGCVHRPDDGACEGRLRPDFDCRDAVCDPESGCRLVPRADACDDEVDCTQDICVRDGDLAGTCLHEPQNALCRDSVGTSSVCDPDTTGPALGCTLAECDTDEQCGTPIGPCVTSFECVARLCVPQPAAAGTSCDDNDPCTTSSQCQGGLCMPGSRRSCDDGNPCTFDSCVVLGGDDQCVNAASLDPGVVIPCPSPVACTTGVCEGSTCVVDVDLCAPSPAQPCGTQSCTPDGSCLRVDDLCASQGRLCLPGGTCGGCLPGTLDCDGGGACETLGVSCPVLDGGNVPDAGFTGSCSRPASGGGCGAHPGHVACANDACCDCPIATHMCETDAAGDRCVPRAGACESCPVNTECSSCGCNGTFLCGGATTCDCDT